MEAYRRDLEAFFRHLESRGIQSSIRATREDVSRLLSERRAQGRSEATLRRQVSSLRTYYRFLVVEGEILENPLADLLLPKGWKRLPHILSVSRG